jgi:hypothetical protein
MAREIGSGAALPRLPGPERGRQHLERRRAHAAAHSASWSAGYSRQEIEDFFVGKYGEWVLLAPPNQGMNRIVWIGPALAAAIGLIIAGTFVRGGSSAPPPSPSPAARPDDPYKARLLSEVEDD